MNIYHFKRAVISGLNNIILNAPPLVGTHANDSFGFSVDFNNIGNICVVGNPDYNTTETGAVKVYKQNPSTLLWEQLGGDILGNTDERIGYSVAITDDGNRIVVGSKASNPNTVNGSIYVYDYDGTVWAKTSTITGEGISYWSGFSVTINSTGNVVAFGSPKDDASGTDRGSVVIYRQQLSEWVKIGTLYGELVDDNSGWSIALNSLGNILVVGAPFNNSPTTTDTGHVRIYQYAGPTVRTPSPLPTTWNQIGIDIDGTANSQGGFSVACNASGTTIAIGNIHDSTLSENAGVVKVYRNISGSWVQYGDAIIGDANDLAGYSVSLDNIGGELAVGYPYKDSASVVDTGAVDIYKYINSAWRKSYFRIPGKTVSENSGWSLALSKNARNIIIGAPNYVEGGNKLGIARIYTLPKQYSFWDFNYSAQSILNTFKVTSATSPSIVIKWGDGTADTTTTSAMPVSHTYTI
jgi:hypothetical protein